MKKIPKKWLVPLIPLSIMMLAGAGYIGYTHFHKETVTVTQKILVDGEKIPVVHEQESTVEQEFPQSMSETEVQNAIHQMSHQKVESKNNQKWGAIPLTPERVKRLLKVVQSNSDHYQHADIYIEILTHWDKGNFDDVVSDHNAIWNMQEGTVGKAIAVATPEEEKEFIQTHFHVQQ